MNCDIQRGLKYLTDYMRLLTLDLRGNKIIDDREIKALAGCEFLISLDLRGNPISKDRMSVNG